jgi:hypothetical protein
VQVRNADVVRDCLYPKLEFLHLNTVPVQPDPTYSVSMRHCSGCPLGSSGACSNAGTPFSLNLDFYSVSGLNTSVAVLRPPVPLQVSSQTSTGLIISGSAGDGVSIDIALIQDGLYPATGSISFANSRINVSLEQSSCYPSPTRRSSRIDIICKVDSVGTLVVRGSA